MSNEPLSRTHRFPITRLASAHGDGLALSHGCDACAGGGLTECPEDGYNQWMNSERIGLWLIYN